MATDATLEVHPPPRLSATGRRGDRWITDGLVLCFFMAYAASSVTRFHRMATKSWDLAIFEQAIRGYAHLAGPIADIKGPGFNLLGDHFSPLIAVLGPAYRMFPSPITLLLAQAGAIALSILPVTRLARQRLGDARGVSVGIAYGLSWGLQNAVDADFHEVALAVPLLAFALEALVQDRWRSVLLYTVPLVLVKEDLGLTAAVVGVLLARHHRRPGWGNATSLELHGCSFVPWLV